MKRWNIWRLLLTLFLSTLLWAVLAGASLLVGSTGQIGLPAHWPPHAAYSYRLEMVLLASLVGAALAGAGVVYQAILRNPLADPYLLGVSSGAMLMAYIWQFPAITAWGALLVGMAAMGQQAFAFIGALVSVGIVFVLSMRRGRLNPITLILVGVIVNAVNGSIFLLINAFNQYNPGSGGPLTFLVGGLQSNLTTGQELSAAICIGIGWVILFYFTGQLNAAGLSEAEAQSLGVRIHLLRWIGLIVASLITASAVAISGPIGFVGLVCPHLARLIVGNDQRKLLPVGTALGAGLLAVADAASRLLSRTDLTGTLLPVGVLTGLMGGPFFLFLLWRSRRTPSLKGGTTP